MKVVCVLGSPRAKGNSETIAGKFLETAKSLGAETETFFLHDLSFSGCHACMACKEGAEECVVEDDLLNVLRAARASDVLVMTSPIYFGQVTGQLKCFIDRTFSFLNPDFWSSAQPSRLAPGKKCVFIFTQGDSDEKSFDIFSGYRGAFEMFGFETHCIRGLGLTAPTDAAGRPELLKQAQDLARQLVR